ncbi:MAG: zinc ribbon domain-containing protein [Bacteroidia bacterium]|nr:zinc ribbon domain-containing protein [Bacteroidia bacterium]
MNQILKYTCPKCGNKQYEIGEMWTIGSFWTRMFEFHNRRFTFISCQRCRYTELYKIPKKNIGEVINNLTR